MLAGPVEAAALGNVLVQLHAFGERGVAGGDARGRPRAPREVSVYEPDSATERWSASVRSLLRPARVGGSDRMTAAYDLLAAQLAARGDDVARVEAALARPGGRDAVVGVRQLRDALRRVRAAGRAARPVREARGRGRGASPDRGRAVGRAAHPVGPGRRLRASCASTRSELGLRLGAINPNLFQDPEYKLGSVCHPDAAVRRRAVDHLLECIEIAGAGRLGRRSRSGSPTARTTRARTRSRARRARLVDVPAARSYARARRRRSSCSSSTSSTSRRSTRTDLADWGSALLALPGARRAARRCSSISATTRRA